MTSHNPNDERERYCGNCHQFISPEIGRELKVSELKPRTIVWLKKPGRAMATVWVVVVHPEWVHFRASAIGMDFLAKRDGDGVRDDDLPMKIYEYLGKP
jgi:hypothetical protein